MDTTRSRLADALAALSDTASHTDVITLPEAATRSQLIEPLLTGMDFAVLDDRAWSHHVKASGQRIDSALKVSGDLPVAAEPHTVGPAPNSCLSADSPFLNIGYRASL